MDTIKEMRIKLMVMAIGLLIPLYIVEVSRPLAIKITAVIVSIIAVKIIYKIIARAYFRSIKFKEIVYRLNLDKYVQDYNIKARQLEEIKTTSKYISNTVAALNFDTASRKVHSYVHKCSVSVCANAAENPEKYICKYFNIDVTEECLQNLIEIQRIYEDIAEIIKQLNIIVDKIASDTAREIPIIFRNKKVRKIMYIELGMDELRMNEDYFIKFVFEYVSPQGRSFKQYIYSLDNIGVGKIIHYMQDKVTGKEFNKKQRSLMTDKLRKEILERDNYTCKKCGNSTYDEKNLLLEVDHIIPVSKGGKTVPENLQTLCWKCNRSKGNKT